jgi:hypothetical protein
MYQKEIIQYCIFIRINEDLIRTYNNIRRHGSSYVAETTLRIISTPEFATRC